MIELSKNVYEDESKVLLQSGAGLIDQLFLIFLYSFIPLFGQKFRFVFEKKGSLCGAKFECALEKKGTDTSLLV